jgi:hypothetical protein
MFKRIKEIIELIKLLYIKISIACCCKSNCQIGRDEKGYKIPKPPPPSPSNDDNHVDDTRAAYTSII